jgi:hypothetical protein
VLVDGHLRDRLRRAGIERAKDFAVARIAEAHLADFRELLAARGVTA